METWLVAALAVVGLYVVLWWVIGVIAFTYTHTYISPRAPAWQRFKMVAQSGFNVPWLMLSQGIWPSEIITVLAPAHPTEEDMAHFHRWWVRSGICDCANCQKERGE